MERYVLGADMMLYHVTAEKIEKYYCLGGWEPIDPAEEEAFYEMYTLHITEKMADIIIAGMLADYNINVLPALRHNKKEAL